MTAFILRRLSRAICFVGRRGCKIDGQQKELDCGFFEFRLQLYRIPSNLFVTLTGVVVLHFFCPLCYTDSRTFHNKIQQPFDIKHIVDLYSCMSIILTEDGTANIRQFFATLSIAWTAVAMKVLMSGRATNRRI